ncbi:MAG: imidazole glycerol phosphate synthase subunit HisH [Clostridia bacterium]|nr:imidazole glycerol phosphate synthase subunit HisH [Clostridia bacterium]
MVAIIDYGAGNILSVQKALDHIGCENVVTSDREVIMSADGAVLPGVGSFGDAMDNLHKNGLTQAVKNFMSSGRPFLGICLGLQVLFDSSEESPDAAGLSVFSGKVRRFPAGIGLKIPQIGWNSIDYDRGCPIFKGLPENPYVYFVHSYYLEASDESVVSAVAEYGVRYHAAVARGNVFATQFHPEKSGEVGLQILRNFAELI